MAGIHHLECYIPCTAVRQTDMERMHDCEGKYTSGLEQTAMSVVDAREDVHSMCLSALHRLFEGTSISPRQVGRVEVGTETLLDTSKSAKTLLMDYFASYGNTDVEGVSSFNACYGGTAALFNSIAWVQSEAWDGRYAVVVASDVAVYAPGRARATGGAGAVAMLIGPDAPLCLDPVRASYCANAYDFYKPLGVAFPVVDGSLANACYLRALGECWSALCTKAPARLSDFKSVLLHAPYCKLTRRGYARLAFLDAVKENAEGLDTEKVEALWPPSDTGTAEEAKWREISKADFASKVEPSLLLAKECGNMYTASLYACLSSLVSSQSLQNGERILMYSYGSGLMASMFTMYVRDAKALRANAVSLRLPQRISERSYITALHAEEVLAGEAKTHTPLSPGTFYKNGLRYQRCS